LIYTCAMPKAKIAKLFKNGRSQAVRLPKEFRFEGDRVRVRRVKEGVLLEPMLTDVRKWFAELDRLRASGTFPARAKQRKPPIRRYFD
jgi:antitoxin VapB